MNTAEEANKAMSEANNSLMTKQVDLIACLKEARDQFAYYGKNHRTKAEGFRHSANGQFKDDPMRRENLLEDAQSADDKAEVNESWVRKIDGLLASVTEQS